MSKKPHFPFWLITIALFIGLIIPVLIQDGMFMDGLLYTCVSKNMANGLGSFWSPYFSETWEYAGRNAFHEHPPLIFGIQALFFKLLGNSIYVERFYSFLTAIINAGLIIHLWRYINKSDQSIKEIAWLPVFFWITIPVCFWSFQNNVHENTMGIFTLLSIIFGLKACAEIRGRTLNILLSGVFIFLASFSKGVPGLFPIALPAIFWFSQRSISFKQALVYTIFLVGIPAIIYAILLQFEAPNQNLTFYFKERLIGRIASSHTVSNRFHTAERLISELLPAIAICLLIFFWMKRKVGAVKFNSTQKKSFLLFLLIGLSGSLPLMLTHVQRAFYFSHSLPFFAMAFAILVAPFLVQRIESINPRSNWIKISSAFGFLLLSGALLLSLVNIGKASRSSETLHDVYVLRSIIPEKTTIRIDQQSYDEWDLQCNLVRHSNISSDVSKINRTYFLMAKSRDSLKPTNYEKLPLETLRYDLYEIND